MTGVQTCALPIYGQGISWRPSSEGQVAILIQIGCRQRLARQVGDDQGQIILAYNLYIRLQNTARHKAGGPEERSASCGSGINITHHGKRRKVKAVAERGCVARIEAGVPEDEAGLNPLADGRGMRQVKKGGHAIAIRAADPAKICQD